MPNVPEIYPYVVENGVSRRLIVGPHSRILRYAQVGDVVEIGLVRYRVDERLFDTEAGGIKIRFVVVPKPS